MTIRDPRTDPQTMTLGRWPIAFRRGLSEGAGNCFGR
jgi:hypothetical protein